jgi:flagellar assembly protein FliH
LSSNIIPKDEAQRARRWEPVQIDAGLAPNSVGTIVHGAARPSSGSQTSSAALAENESRQIRENAAMEGFQQGLQEGRAQGARDAAEMKALVASLREVSQALEQSLSERILELAVEIARVVVRHALEVRPEFVIDVVREAVASLPEMEAHAEISLHPDDAVLLREVLRSDPNAALPWHVVEDPQVNRGGCRVVTRSSEIDATLDSRWRRVVATLGRDERWFPAPAAGRKTDSPSDG